MKLIDKDRIAAEIERLKGQLVRGACASQVSMETNCKVEAYNEVLSFLDTLEVKEVDNTEYWLVSVRYVLNGGNAESNCFFSYFPTKQDIQNTIGAEKYTILHMQNLAEEQFNKLTGREHGKKIDERLQEAAERRIV